MENKELIINIVEKIINNYKKYYTTTQRCNDPAKDFLMQSLFNIMEQQFNKFMIENIYDIIDTVLKDLDTKERFRIYSDVVEYFDLNNNINTSNEF